MREKIVPVVFLMLVLLIGFPSSAVNFSIFADDGDDGDEIEIEGEIDEINLESMFFTIVGSILKIFVNEDTEFDEGFDSLDDLAPGFHVDVDVVLSNGSHVATEIEVEDDGDEEEIDGNEEENDNKIEICHIPKGNPSNAHTITVGAPAYRAHMAHGDLEEPCVDGDGTIHDKYEEKLNKKLAKLDEKRAKLEQKLNELSEILGQELGHSELTFTEKQAKKADKLALKLERLSEKYDELQAKYSKKSDEIQQNLLQNIDQLHPRTQKLLEKLNTEEYFGDFHEDEDEIREYILSFDSLTAEPFGQSSEPSEFSADITLTSSSSGSSGNLKFKVTGCIIIGEEVSYSCAFGKARTISSGTSGNEEKLAIIALLQDDDSEFTPSLKIFVTPTDSSIASLEEGSINVSIHSEITLQWSISGEGTLTILDSGEATQENN